MITIRKTAAMGPSTEFRTEQVLLKGGREDGALCVLKVSCRRVKLGDIGVPTVAYKRTGEVLDGVAVFRWEGEL